MKKLCSMYAVIQNDVKTSLFGQVTGPRSHNSSCQYQVTSSSHPSIVPVNISNSVSFLFLVSWQLVWNRKKLHNLRPQLWGTRRSINIVLSSALKLINCSQTGTFITKLVVNQSRCCRDQEPVGICDHDNYADNKQGNIGFFSKKIFANSYYKIIAHEDNNQSCKQSSNSYIQTELNWIAYSIMSSHVLKRFHLM